MSALLVNPIFISYSRRDENTMRKIAFFLRDLGFKVWVDNEKLIPGTSAWEESIENAIKNAFAVIVILSPDSKGSEWVRREITYADQFQKRLFPVLVRGTEEMSLPIRLVTRQYVDLREGEEAGLESLKAAITFYMEEKKTLEMKRPSEIQKNADTPGSKHRTVDALQKVHSSNKRGRPAVLFAVVCVLTLAAFWIGYRLYTPSIPVTVTDPAEPTSMAVPTNLAIYTPTNLPLDAPTPADPNVPVPDILSQYLVDAQITSVDTFDNLQAGWEVQAGRIENGVMEINGNDDWKGAWRDRVFMEGEGALIDFSFSEGSTFTIHLNNGLYGGNSYRRFGIFFENDFPMTDIYIGDFIWEDLTIHSGFQPSRFYTILIARLSNEEFMETVWDISTQSVVAEFRKKFDGMPAGSSWTFLIQAPKGTIQFDNYQEIGFNAVK